MICPQPTFDFGNKAEAFLEVGADAVEAPAELGIAAVLVGAAGVVTHVQLVAALGHGRDSHVHLADNRSASAQVEGKKLSFLCLIVPPLEWADRRSTSCIRQAPASGSQGEE